MADDGSETDRRLAEFMRAAQAGDQRAYAQLLNALTPMLRRAVRYRRAFLQPSDVEDLVQEILLSIHEARATYDPARPLLPWIMAITRNRLADGARRYMARSAREVVVEELPETFSEDETNTLDGYGDPEALRMALTTLPPGQRQAIELMKLRELSLKEASAQSGTSIAALKVAVHRGMIALRKALGTKA